MMYKESENAQVVLEQRKNSMNSVKNAEFQEDCLEFKGKLKKKAMRKATHTPVVVRPELSSKYVIARAVNGERIEVASPKMKNDYSLIRHERCHIVQQLLARETPEQYWISESQAEAEANADQMNEISPCGKWILNKDENSKSVDKAIKYNQELQLRPDFVIRLKVKLGELYNDIQIDVDRSDLHAAIAFDKKTIDAIKRFQMDHGINANGNIDAKTREFIEAILFQETGWNAVIGPNRTEGEVLISGIHDARKGGKIPVDQKCYERCAEIIEKFGNTASKTTAGGFFNRKPGAVNILAIRGARIEGQNIVRTGGAQGFFDTVISNPDGNKRSTNVDVLKKQLYFFSSSLKPGKSNNGNLTNNENTKNYAFKMSRDEVFDDIFLSIWTDEQGKYYVQARQGSVDPGEYNYGKKDYDGTAHLRDGQYLYQMGRHNTTHKKHIRSVLYMCKIDNKMLDLLQVEIIIKSDRRNNQCKSDRVDECGKEKILLNDKNVKYADDKILEYKGNKIASISYSALIKKIPTEVVREELNSNNGICSLVELKNSVNKCGNNNSRFRDIDHSIMINIHTSPNDETSSQGCQNIPIDTYKEFISEVNNNHKNEVLYTLLDGSKIKENRND